MTLILHTYELPIRMLVTPSLSPFSYNCFRAISYFGEERTNEGMNRKSSDGRDRGRDTEARALSVRPKTITSLQTRSTSIAWLVQALLRQ